MLKLLELIICSDLIVYYIKIWIFPLFFYNIDIKNLFYNLKKYEYKI